MVPFVPLFGPLTDAHEESPPSVVSHSWPWATGFGLSEPLAPPVHRYTSIVLTVPPLVNADTINRSPSVWLPWNKPPPWGQATVPCRNQNATLPSPVTALRSSAKYRMSLPAG